MIYNIRFDSVKIATIQGIMSLYVVHTDHILLSHIENCRKKFHCDMQRAKILHQNVK